MIKVYIKDLLTKEVKLYPNIDITVWSWTEGNWSCDCNRVLAFQEDIDFSLPCECKRYIVVAAKGDLEGMTEREFINECNREYIV